MSTFHTPASLRNFQRLIERIDAEAMREETSFPKSLTVTVPESFRFPVARFEREAWTYLRSVASESLPVLHTLLRCSPYFAERLRTAPDALIEHLSSPAFSSFRAEFDEEVLLAHFEEASTPPLRPDHLLRLRLENVHARAFTMHYWMSAHPRGKLLRGGFRTPARGLPGASRHDARAHHILLRRAPERLSLLDASEGPLEPLERFRPWTARRRRRIRFLSRARPHPRACGSAR